MENRLDLTTDNPFHPLPRNYGELTPGQQQAARIAAVRLQDTPEDFVRAWTLFRELYLFTTPPGQFYPNKRLESPPAHYEWVHDFWRYSRNIIGAPRASAKSIVLGKEIPLLLALSKPYTRIMLVLANKALVYERMSELMFQMAQNDSIIRDFGVQRPLKGSSLIWNRSHLCLLNGSVIYGTSVDARKRGPRPSIIILDDPEYDPKTESIDTELTRQLNTLLFKQLLPMLDDEGCRFMWDGTMLSRRSALWSSCMGDDPRFTYWNRRIYSRVYRDAVGHTTYFWLQKWGPETIARQRLELGEAAWQAEAQNNPSSEQDRILHLHPQFNFYTVTGQKVMWTAPGPSTGTEVHERAYDSWLSTLSRIFLVDPAITESRTSDYCYILALGIDPDDCWWALDAFMGRISDTRLIDELYRMGVEWQPVLIGVESVAFQDKLRRFVESALAARTAGTSWQPRIWPVRYPPKLSKSARIEGLAPRIGRHLIRLPNHLRGTTAIDALIEQIEDFTPDLTLLPHDDAVDSLSMTPYCPRVSSTGRARLVKDDSIIGQLLAGRTTEKETGLPLFLFVNPQTLPPEVLDRIRSGRVSQHLRDTQIDRSEDAQEFLRELGSSLTRDDDTMSTMKSPADQGDTE